MIIAVDFDGTIVEHDFPNIGEPIGRSVEILRNARLAGHKLILWTCRVSAANLDPDQPRSSSVDAAVEFCNDHNLEFDAVNENVDPTINFADRKVVADWYIDDRACWPGMTITPEVWEDIELAIIRAVV